MSEVFNPVEARVVERLTRPGPKRILALDGGGVRGILTAAMLARIEEILAERHPDPDAFRLADYFDLIGGTSTGAIIATWLALGRRARDLAALYHDLCPRIFKPKLFGAFGVTSRFDSAELEAALTEELGDARLRTADWRTGWATFAKRVDTCAAWTLTNNPRAKFWNGDATDGALANGDYSVAKVVKASASAPVFFDATEIDVLPGQDPGLFFDGAVTPFNNPSLQLFLAASLPGYGFGWPTGRDKLLVISLGTGFERPRIDAAKFKSLNHYFKAVHALTTMIYDVGLHATATLQALSEPIAPWTVNSEIGDMRGQRASAGELLSFQRIDPTLDADWLTENLGLTFADRDVRRLAQIDDARRDNLDRLEQIGAEMGRRLIRDDFFPEVFDPAPQLDLNEIPAEIAEVSTAKIGPRVAFTGHRPDKLGGDRAAIKRRIAEALTAVRLTAGGSGTVATGFAEGADRLAADVALDTGWRIAAVSPMAPDEYEMDFAESASRQNYRDWLEAVDDNIELNVSRAAPDDAAPYAALAGWLADWADVVVAVWDGAPAAGPGGVADVVARALEADKPVLWIDVDGAEPPRVLGPDGGAHDARPLKELRFPA